jgi:hypothetical protein
MIRRSLRLTLAPVLATLVFSSPSLAGDGNFDLGLRANIVGGSGEPTNDVLGFGLFGHYRFNDRWRIGFALDHSPEFDVERTGTLVGLVQDPAESEIDSIGTSTEIKGWIERVYTRPGSRWEWFWLAGLGLNDVDVDPLQGSLEGGGQFDIATDASTEAILTLGVGGRRWFRGDWGLEAVLSGDQHFADWKYLDRVSGATGTTDDYFLRGVRIGILKRF